MNATLPDSGARLRALLSAAGHAAAALWSPRLAVSRKADGSPVTAADTAAEAVIVRGLRDAWPGDRIWSEEGGAEEGMGPGDSAWVVDPIDGTSVYTEGLAHWGPTVARLVRDDGPWRLDRGALLLPRTGEFWYVEGGIAWCHDARMAPLADLDPPRVLFLPSEFHRHARLVWHGKARCVGGTAAHLALVARGAAHGAVVTQGWKPWDVAAGVGLLAAVGGVARTWPEGEPLDIFRHEGRPFVAGTPVAAHDLLFGGHILPHPLE